MIKKNKINFYKKNGYLVLKNFIKKKYFIPLQESLNSILKLNIYSKKISFFDNKKINSTLFSLRRRKTFSKFYKTFQNLVGLDMIFFNKKLLLLVSKLLNCRDFDLNSSGKMLRLDAPSDDKFSYGWHQDSFYYNQNPKTNSGLVVLFPLSTTNEKNGSLKIIPCSQVGGRRVHKKDLNSGYFTIQNLSKNIVNNKLQFNYNLGDIIILNLNTIHASGENISKSFRISAGIRFHSVKARDFKPYALKTVF